jgi:small subunit ribosomal protein S21
VVKLTLRERESIQEAVRRFRKLVERSGIKKEMRVREFYEKPSETKRRAPPRRAAPAVSYAGRSLNPPPASLCGSFSSRGLPRRCVTVAVVLGNER